MRFIYSLNNILEFIPTDNIAMANVDKIKKSKKIIEFEGGYLEGFFSIEGSNIVASVKLTTPLGNVILKSVNVNPSHPKAVISGGNEGYKARVYLDFNNNNLKLNSIICIPFYGCKKGNTEINIY